MRKIILFILLFLSVITLIVSHIIESRQNNPLFEKQRIIKRMEEAGGIQIINKEAIDIFDKIYADPEIGTYKKKYEKKKYINTFWIISFNTKEKQRYPATASLGKFIGGFYSDPSYIEIKYGTHRHWWILYIYDPREEVSKIKLYDSYIKITDNIYLSQ